MIRLLNGEPVPLRRTVTAVHFHSLRACYGENSGVVEFWRAGEALLYCLGGTLHISGYVRNVGELSDFVRMMGFSRVYCTENLAHRAGWQPQLTVYELVQTRNFSTVMPGENLNLQEIYDVLKVSGGAIDMPPFAEFCVDFSHRLRHGGARCVGDRRGVAITTAETTDFACIGGVAVLPQYRGSGYGSRLVQSLCAELGGEQKTVLTRTTKSLLPFYRANGFALYGRYCWAKPDKKYPFETIKNSGKKG